MPKRISPIEGTGLTAPHGDSNDSSDGSDGMRRPAHRRRQGYGL